MKLAWREKSLLYRVLLGLAALGTFPVERAQASDAPKQCLRAYEAGQRLRQAGDFVNAAVELRTCGGPACPVRVQGDCQRWLDDVERSTPTVVFRVRTASGEQLSNVTVSIDGDSPRQLDGRALQMNPGEHRMLFQHPAYHALQTSVFVTEGEKLERREVTLRELVSVRRAEMLLPRDHVDHVDPVASSISPWPLALGAVGVLGGASFVFFSLRARSGETDLERCSPDCSQAHVDDVERDFLWSNVSLGVGLAAFVGAGLWWLFDDRSAQALTTPRHGVRVGPTTSWVTRF